VISQPVLFKVLCGRGTTRLLPCTELPRLPGFPCFLGRDFAQHTLPRASIAAPARTNCTRFLALAIVITQHSYHHGRASKFVVLRRGIHACRFATAFLTHSSTSPRQPHFLFKFAVPLPVADIKCCNSHSDLREPFVFNPMRTPRLPKPSRLFTNDTSPPAPSPTCCR